MTGIVLGTLGPVGDGAPRERGPEEVRRIEAVNAALVKRIERMTDTQANAFSLFQTAIHLESQVRGRTAELSQALARVEQTSRDNLAAREAADRANRFKTTFLASAGHDILQPLNAARLSLSTLDPSGLDASGRRSLDTVAAALDTMEELIAAVLDMARIDSGDIRPEIGPVSLLPLAEGLAREFAPLSARKGLSLRVAGRPLVGLSDAALLKRVLANLVSNAIRYTGEGGVLMTVRPRGGAALVEVRDTGVGIPPGEHEAVFREFHRSSPVGRNARAASAGLGLGLSIVRGLVDALGHPLEMRSVEGRGSVFRVFVPLGSASRPAGEAATPFPAPRVLLVGGAPALEQARALFERWGFSVSAVSDAEGARLAARAGEPDLLVVGGRSGEAPGMAGDIVGQVRVLSGRRVPAILLLSEAGAPWPLAGDAGVEIVRGAVKPAMLRALVFHLLSRAEA